MILSRKSEIGHGGTVFAIDMQDALYSNWGSLFGVGQAGVESFWGVELPVHDVKEGGRVISQNIIVFDDGRPV